MKAKSDFLRIYSNLPLHVRKQVIVTIDKEPITWQVAYHMIKDDKEEGRLLLTVLKKLGII